jgi:SAM-dependent methyltransferase
MTIITTDKPLRPRSERDYYPTQASLVEAALKLLHRDMRPNRILDPGCGQGAWGAGAKARFPGAQVWGIDIQIPEQLHPAYGFMIQDDFLAYNFLDAKFDLIIGNPPYRYSEEFIRKSWDVLQPWGTMLFLLRTNFLASKKRMYGLWTEIRPSMVHILSTRPSFTGDNKSDDNEYALFYWSKRRHENMINSTRLIWYDWKRGYSL